VSFIYVLMSFLSINVTLQADIHTEVSTNCLLDHSFEEIISKCRIKKNILTI